MAVVMESGVQEAAHILVHCTTSLQAIEQTMAVIKELFLHEDLAESRRCKQDGALTQKALVSSIVRPGKQKVEEAYNHQCLPKGNSNESSQLAQSLFSRDNCTSSATKPSEHRDAVSTSTGKGGRSEMVHEPGEPGERDTERKNVKSLVEERGGEESGRHGYGIIHRLDGAASGAQKGKQGSRRDHHRPHRCEWSCGHNIGGWCSERRGK